MSLLSFARIERKVDGGKYSSTASQTIFWLDDTGKFTRNVAEEQLKRHVQHIG